MPSSKEDAKEYEGLYTPYQESCIEDGRKYWDEYSISFSMFCLFRDALMFKSKEDALDFWERHKSRFIHKDLIWAEIVEVNLEDKGSLYERYN